MIQIPLINCIEDGESGADFAYWFENGYGEPIRMMVCEFGPKNLSIPAVQAIMLAFDNFPPLKMKLDQLATTHGFTQEKLTKWVTEFVEFDRDAYEQQGSTSA